MKHGRIYTNQRLFITLNNHNQDTTLASKLQNCVVNHNAQKDQNRDKTEFHSTKRRFISVCPKIEIPTERINVRLALKKDGGLRRETQLAYVR